MLEATKAVQEFVNRSTESVAVKYFALLLSFIYTTVESLIGPVLYNPIFKILCSLLAMTTLLGTAAALKNKEKLSKCKILGVLKRLTYVACCIFVGIQLEGTPMHLVGVPLANLIYTILICQESSRAMKAISRFYDDSTMNHVAGIVDQQESELKEKRDS